VRADGALASANRSAVSMSMSVLSSAWTALRVTSSSRCAVERAALGLGFPEVGAGGFGPVGVERAGAADGARPVAVLLVVGECLNQQRVSGACRGSHLLGQPGVGGGCGVELVSCGFGGGRVGHGDASEVGEACEPVIGVTGGAGDQGPQRAGVGLPGVEFVERSAGAGVVESGEQSFERWELCFGASLRFAQCLHAGGDSPGCVRELFEPED
jgi:hypothetical protein